jgi:hypothetical protein
MKILKRALALVLVVSFSPPCWADDEMKWKIGKFLQIVGGCAIGIGAASVGIVAATNSGEGGVYLGLGLTGAGVAAVITGGVLRATSNYQATLPLDTQIGITQMGKVPGLAVAGRW